MTNNNTGALKDIPDNRDFRIADYIKEATLPTSLDLSESMGEVRNQGSHPTCVAFATTGMKEYQEKNSIILSPQFLYERVGLPQGGAYPREAMQSLVTEGICPETCQPYNTEHPCDNSLELAKPNKIKGYARLNTIDEMKRSLFQNGAFVISFGINDSWHSTEDGVVRGDGEVTGGHQVLCCGYSDVTGLLKFRNSWSETWGDNGYGHISYGHAIYSLYDAWAAVDIPDNEEYQLIEEKSWLRRLYDWLLGWFR